jgi:hypothetical protein
MSEFPASEYLKFMAYTWRPKDALFTSWAFRQTPLSLSTSSPMLEVVVVGAAGAVNAGVVV